MKKFLILAILSAVTLFANAYDFLVDGLCYTITNSYGKTVEVTCRQPYETYLLPEVVSIPDKVTYNGTTYTVISIGRKAFENSDITSVTIPNTVTTIGDEAFASCLVLSNVNIPGSVTTIGYHAFYWCEGLKSISLPNSVTSIGNGAFYWCESLKSISIPNSITVIGSETFFECISLTNVYIPNSVKTIGYKAFSGCTRLSSISLPSSVTTIGAYVCENCIDLTSVTLPNSITTIGDGVFYGCTKLTDVSFPNSVTRISNDMFHDCTGLTSVTIPNSITQIGESAFHGCSSLTNITIPNSVKRIGHEAFCDCSGLTSLAIPNSVSYLGPGAFKNCSGLTSMIIPNSITKIEYEVFSGCTGLKSVTIPNTITTIDEWAFGNCSSLLSVTFPNSLTSIDICAFSNCISLTSVTIPNTVTSISSNAFSNCRNLTTLTLTGFGAWPAVDGLSSIISQIKTLNVGGCVNSLGDFGFAPKTVNCYNETPPTCTSGTFTSYNGALHVPQAATINYFTADYWQNFGNITNDITKKVSLDRTTAALFESDELQITATTSPEGGEISWYSTDTRIATVDETGKVTAKTVGECDIVAEWISTPEVSASCHISVNYPEITLELDKDSLQFNNVGEQETLTATITPQTTGITPTWATSDATVATVDANGVVTATGVGECDIIATVFDKSATCHVIVNATITISLESTSYFIKTSNILTLTPMFDPIETDITVESSDQSVAYARVVRVNNTPANGAEASPSTGTQRVQVVGVSNGTATVTISSVDGKSVPVTCVVTVMDELSVDGLRYICNSDQTATLTFCDDSDSFANNYTGLTSAIIPPTVTADGWTFTVTAIGEKAFYKCTSLTEVVIPPTVKQVGQLAFYNCTGITSINIPASVEQLDYGVFNSCTNLGTITVEAGNPVFDSRDNCNAVIETATNRLVFGTKNTVVPNTVIAIGSNAFSGHINLTSIQIPNSVTTIENGAFYSCKGLTEFTIPASVQSLGRNAFRLCAGLTSMTVPANVTTLGDGVFSNCIKLKTVILGNGIDSIGKEAFDNDKALEHITCQMPDPTAIAYGTDIFKSVSTTKCRLTVPAGTLEAYAAQEPWSAFVNVDQYYNGDLNGDGNVNTGDVSALYRAILNGSTDALYDINGDGNVNTGDVSLLYSLILEN